MAQHNDTGKWGEELAVSYFESHGYTIREINWTHQKLEIDIIAQKGDTLVIIEVKTRASSDYGLPQDFVKPSKIKRLVKAADAYITLNNIALNVRFDIIAITKEGEIPLFEHIEEAFYYF